MLRTLLLTITITVTSHLTATAQNACSETLPVEIEASPVNAGIRKAADAGDTRSQYQLALAYEFGCGVQTNVAKAAEWMRRAAEHGDALAQENLGVMFHLGNGVPKDAAASMQWFGRAAKQGNAAAMFNIGIAFFNGDTTGEAFQQNYVLAYAWMVLAKEFGSKQAVPALEHFELRPSELAEAESRVGNAYLKGEAVPKNIARALEWLKRAATDGSANAEYNMGLLYANGIEVQKDEQLALQTMVRAVQRDNGFEVPQDAWLHIARMYEEGRGTSKNAKEALRWYWAATGTGRTPAVAYLRIAKIYEEGGEDVKPELAKAYAALLQAKANHVNVEDSELVRLASMMTAKDIKELRVLGITLQKP